MSTTFDEYHNGSSETFSKPQFLVVKIKMSKWVCLWIYIFLYVSASLTEQASTPSKYKHISILTNKCAKGTFMCSLRSVLPSSYIDFPKVRCNVSVRFVHCAAAWITCSSSDWRSIVQWQNPFLQSFIGSFYIEASVNLMGFSLTPSYLSTMFCWYQSSSF